MAGDAGVNPGSLGQHLANGHGVGVEVGASMSFGLGVGRQPGGLAGIVHGDDAHFAFVGDGLKRALEKEAVHLRGGKLKGPQMVQRILRGDAEKELSEGVAFVFHCHLLFRHGLQESGLHAGGGAVDLIHQDDGGKDRPGVEGVVHVVVPGEVGGQEVRRALDAAKLSQRHVAAARVCGSGNAGGVVQQAAAQALG